MKTRDKNFESAKNIEHDHGQEYLELKSIADASID